MRLNNRFVARNHGSRSGLKNHASFEKATFYQLQPDILKPEMASREDWQYEAADLKESWYNAVPLKGLYDDAASLELYLYAMFGKKEVGMDKALVGWFKKHFLGDLNARGWFSIETYVYAGKVDEIQGGLWIGQGLVFQPPMPLFSNHVESRTEPLRLLNNSVGPKL